MLQPLRRRPLAARLWGRPWLRSQCLRTEPWQGGLGKQCQGEVPLPPRPASHFVVIQAAFPLRRLNTLCPRPAGAHHTRQLVQGQLLRARRHEGGDCCRGMAAPPGQEPPLPLVSAGPQRAPPPVLAALPLTACPPTAAVPRRLRLVFSPNAGPAQM
jgi:hypothetical protein